MPPIEELLVAVAERDPERTLRQCDLASGGKYAGDCISCGVRCFVNHSAWEMFRSWDHDPRVICRQCDARYGEEAY